MARGKKAVKELSPEEKLQQAFVPAEEQPYPIPENWCWIKLHFVCEYLKAGGDKPASFVEKKDKEHLIPVVANGIENEGIIGFTNIGQISAGTVSVSGRGTIGYSFLREYEYVPVVRLIVIKPRKNLLPHYLKFIFDVFEEKGTGSSIPQLTVPMIKDKIIPLPPLPEQLRIVSRIESLFAKLDEAKEKAQAVVNSFELRKSAILHKAFTGELTERWRKEHGVGLESWINTIFKSILDVRDGTHDSPEYVDVGYALVTSKNLKDGKITDKNLKYISQDDYNKINARSKVDIGDILFAMIGTIGNPVVIKDKPNYAIKNVALFKNIKKVNPYFVKYYLQTKEVRDTMDRDAKGSTQRFVSLEYLRNFPIPIPTEAEQIELVERVNNLLEKEQQTKEAAEAVLSQIDTMKKAILARAFRGELGTNDPAEEWAGDLVKAVL